VRARDGDRTALEELLATIAPSIHRFGLRMCRNRHDAEDVLQDTLLNVATHLRDFEGRSSLSTWAFSLARSACARKRRGMKNRPPAEDDEGLLAKADPGPGPDVRAGEHEVALALSNALDALPDDYREAVLLRDVEGLSAAEAAMAIGVSVDALKSRLHRARESLRDALESSLEPKPALSSAACPDVALLWSRKLEGDLDQVDCTAMEEHLVVCPRCRSACDALKQALLACRRIGHGDVPPEVQARVKAAVRSWLAT
jgi:RNA polymerase sigma-70 factor (ECF subfamily)